MKKFLEEFKAFAMRGNVVDMAVGIIIGGAFGKIVSSFVGDIVMPALGLLVGGIDFSDLSVTLKQAVMENGQEIAPAVMLRYGAFIQVIIDFVIIAFAIFMMIKAMAMLQRKKAEAVAETPAPAPEPQISEEQKLLAEIRDILKEKK
ncbi:MAG: large-conductance mechanosensitive channel protein MscL [Bacteroidetes bacterium]|uniref:Large-conductance mechanosensitive channel n=1 Tax=Candidatus Egerieousia excrementavium TaxID=2840778 RepID=A0A9D9DMM0_9BACT|nr:large-conductance mechanosensitive channel protein MscL [Candidatus Egerieousia excrementavium]